MIRVDGATKDKLDAVTPNAGIFFQRQLESIEGTIYKFKKKELKYRQYIPVSTRDNPGAETITYRMLDMVGAAVVIANYATDLPRADILGKEFTQKVKSLGTSFGWNTQEIRAAALANVPLEMDKANAARRSIREKESNIAWNGDSDNGIKGLIDNPNIPVQAAPDPGGGTEWANKTPDQIIADISAMVTKVRKQSKGIHNADTLLLPIDQYNLIATIPRSATSDTTILEFIQKPGNSYGLTTVDWLPDELDSAFTGGTEDGAICYERDPEILELRIPLELELLAVQQRGLEFIVPGESRIGGVVVRFPLGMLFFTGI
jgi:hypothetical protein